MRQSVLARVSVLLCDLGQVLPHINVQAHNGVPF